jgi:hypothetical protein
MQTEIVQLLRSLQDGKGGFRFHARGHCRTEGLGAYS